MSWLHAWPKRKPALDERIVGISFVDVLFALVIGEVLSPLRDPSKIPGVGAAQLGVAALLTLTSWVGYHNSRNRPGHFIRFPNLPLAQFVLDISMVVTYWLTAVGAESARERPDARAEAVLVAAAFILYALWDIVGYLIRREKDYERRVPEDDAPARRHTTYVFAVLTCAVAFVALGADTHSARSVYIFDGVLAGLIIAFRFVKEYVDTRAPIQPRQRTPEAKLETVERAVEELRRAWREQS